MKTSELKETIRELIRQTLTEKEKIQGRLPHPNTQGRIHRVAKKSIRTTDEILEEVEDFAQQVKDDGIPVDPKSKKWISQTTKLLKILNKTNQQLIKSNPDDGKNPTFSG